jgi:hypothetical protein
VKHALTRHQAGARRRQRAWRGSTFSAVFRRAESFARRKTEAA